MDYVVIIEPTGDGYGAYVPDLPGCVAVGDCLEEARGLMKEAITFHIDIMREYGETVPESDTSISEALSIHNENLLEHYQELGESVPELPALVELIDVDASPEAIQCEYGHLLPGAHIGRTTAT